MHDKIVEYYKDLYILKDDSSNKVGYYKVFSSLEPYSITEKLVATKFPDGRIEYYFDGKSYSEEDMLKILKLDIYY